MKLSTRILLVFAALLFIGVAHASADTLAYTLTGPVSASWELSGNPAVFAVNPDFSFNVTPINLVINGVASSDNLTFFTTAGGGALLAFSDPMSPDFSLAGIELFTGDVSSPTMLVVNGITLMDFMTGDAVFTLTSTPVGPTPTPEPSAVLLLTLGMAAMALGTFISRRAVSLSASAS